VATKVGAVRWSICIYDEEFASDVVFCGDATATIR
jgi:hypothetical protein